MTASGGEPHDLDVPATGASPTTRLANLIVSEAIQQNATQVHLHSDGTSVLYCINGEWKLVMRIPSAAFRPLVNRLRVMGNLDRTRGHTRQEADVNVVGRGSQRSVRVAVQYTDDDNEEAFIYLD